MSEPGRTEAGHPITWLSELVVSTHHGNSAGGAGTQVPVTCGLPLPRGKVTDVADLILCDSSAARQVLQTRVLERWSDGSIRWVLLDWMHAPSETSGYRVGLEADRQQLPSPGRSYVSVTVDTENRNAAVDTGRARFVVDTTRQSLPLASLRIDDREWLDGSRTGLWIEDSSGGSLHPRYQRLMVEDEGPVRVRLRIDGALKASNSSTFALLTLQLDFFADSSFVELEMVLTNPRAAKHPGGIWQLGDPGSILIREAALRLALPEINRLSRTVLSAESGVPTFETNESLEIYQDSSGGENWNSRNHLDRNGEIACRFRGYELRAGERRERGLRASPLVSTGQEGQWLSVACSRFWETFPQSIEAGRGVVTWRFLPQEFGDLHEIQGGERLTRRCVFGFDRQLEGGTGLGWMRQPVLVHPRPEWYVEAEPLVCLSTWDSDPNAGYLELVGKAIEGPESFFAKREQVDEYGWRHFGDLYADHEAAFHRGPDLFLSHYNNQYDAVAGFAIQFMRSGDPRWFRLMDDLARHVVDIDLYHTDRDKSTYNGGQFWHTVHYIDAGLSNHRAYPRSPEVHGGGPSTGNLYSTGLLLHYFMTGDPASRAAVMQLGDYVIDADDGTKSIFRFVDSGPTGHVSESGFDGFHGPGRSPANAILALINADRLADDDRYLSKAEELMHRCIHPDDDLAARDLLDAEHRWYYTMFLQSLAAYLDHKRERQCLDREFAYARTALLHYAEWAADHEYPYLDKPEILEFPTETWAAQDLRKVEVFNRAAMYSSGDLRERLLARAEFFFDDAIARLSSMPTATFCRPLVLLMTNGYSQAFFASNRDRLPEMPSTPVGPIEPPTSFISQKARVKRKLRVFGIIVGAGLVLTLMGLWLVLI